MPAACGGNRGLPASCLSERLSWGGAACKALGVAGAAVEPGAQPVHDQGPWQLYSTFRLAVLLASWVGNRFVYKCGCVRCRSNGCGALCRPCSGRLSTCARWCGGGPTLCASRPLSCPRRASRSSFSRCARAAAGSAGVRCEVLLSEWGLLGIAAARLLQWRQWQECEGP
jgi:hypothetical protein